MRAMGARTSSQVIDEIVQVLVAKLVVLRRTQPEEPPP
jgi:hypothetical protein